MFKFVIGCFTLCKSNSLFLFIGFNVGSVMKAGSCGCTKVLMVRLAITAQGFNVQITNTRPTTNKLNLQLSSNKTMIKKHFTTIYTCALTRLESRKSQRLGLSITEHLANTKKVHESDPSPKNAALCKLS